MCLFIINNCWLGSFVSWLFCRPKISSNKRFQGYVFANYGCCLIKNRKNQLKQHFKTLWGSVGPLSIAVFIPTLPWPELLCFRQWNPKRRSHISNKCFLSNYSLCVDFLSPFIVQKLRLPHLKIWNSDSGLLGAVCFANKQAQVPFSIIIII